MGMQEEQSMILWIYLWHVLWILQIGEARTKQNQDSYNDWEIPLLSLPLLNERWLNPKWDRFGRENCHWDRRWCFVMFWVVFKHVWERAYVLETCWVMVWRVGIHVLTESQVMNMTNPYNSCKPSGMTVPAPILSKNDSAWTPNMIIFLGFDWVWYERKH